MTEVQGVIDAFSIQGLTLRPKALKLLSKNCCSNPNLNESEKEEYLEALLARLTNIDNVDSDVKIPEDGIVEPQHITKAIAELEGRSKPKEHQAVSILDLFETKIPKFIYHNQKQDMLEVEHSDTVLFNESTLVRTDMLLHRLHHLKARLHRLKYGDDLSSVELMKNVNNEGKKFIVLGMIIKTEDSAKNPQQPYYLEDDSGHINLDFSGTNFISGCYFIEDCFYIVEGFVEDSVLKVLQIALPPIEPTERLRGMIGTKNLFGTESKRCSSSLSHLEQIEKSRSDVFFIFMNEVWLDKPHCLKRVFKMFSGFLNSNMIPAAIIMTGNFSNLQHVNELVAIKHYESM